MLFSMFDSALCRFLRQVNEYRLMMDRGKDFLHQVLRCNCERRGVDARMSAEARVFQNGLVNDQLHLVFPVVHQPQHAHRAGRDVQKPQHILRRGK